MTETEIKNEALIKKLRLQIRYLQEAVRHQHTNLLKVTKGRDWPDPPEFLFEHIEE